MPTRRPRFTSSWILLVASATAQSEQANGPIASGHLPLHEGARWTYALSRQAGEPSQALPSTVVMTDEGGFSMSDGDRIHQLRIETGEGQAPTFECWSVRKDGIYRHSTRESRQRGTIDLAATPARLLALPLGHSVDWTWNGPHDFAIDAKGGDWAHRATVVAAAAAVAVEAGTFETVHVRITSERNGSGPCTRDIWFAADVGIVREVLRGDSQRQTRELTTFSPARDPATERLQRHLEAALTLPGSSPFNNPPWIGWIDSGPEAMLLPGRIAVVKAETWSGCYYVDAVGVYRFDPMQADHCALAARAAFGSKAANPPEHMPLAALALLLARAHAERCHLSKVRVVPATLRPAREPRKGTRCATVEVIGGAPDGTMRRVAVWLTIDRSSQIQIATDAVDPGPPGR